MTSQYRARSSNAFLRCTPLSGVHLHFREYLEIKTNQAGRRAEQGRCILNRIACFLNSARRLAGTRQSLAKCDARLEHIGMRGAVRIRIERSPYSPLSRFEGEFPLPCTLIRMTKID
jgi:hypothetical protein